VEVVVIEQLSGNTIFLACTGTVTTMHAEETAAASTRLLRRNLFMRLPRNDGGDLPPVRKATLTPIPYGSCMRLRCPGGAPLDVGNEPTIGD
jgi:hypothetical protein